MPEEQIENSNLNTTPVAQSTNSNDINNTTPFIPNFSTSTTTTTTTNHNTIDNASANNTNKLVEQLTTQLNIQTANSQQQSASPQQPQQQTPHLPMQPLQPTPAPAPVSNAAATAAAAAAANEQLQQQLQFAQFYQMPSSIFATPQSMPTSPTSAATAGATPTAQPFMMPTGTTPLFYPQQYQATYPGGGTTQVMMMPVQIATINGVQQPVMMAIPSTHANMFAAAAGTPLMSAAQMPATPTTLLASPSATSVTAAANATGLPLSSGSLVANPNETFEQKWARIQAQKKTNPFAEDIAKKFEIKLT